MLGNLLSRVVHPGARESAAAAAAQRQASVDAAVAWWVEALRGRGVGETALGAFGEALAVWLAAKLAVSYRVYLEVDQRPRGVLAEAMQAAGLLHGVLPFHVTTAVTYTQVDVAAGMHAPYAPLRAA